MTVKELIRRLNRFNENAEVYFSDMMQTVEDVYSMPFVGGAVVLSPYEDMQGEQDDEFDFFNVDEEKDREIDEYFSQYHNQGGVLMKEAKVLINVMEEFACQVRLPKYAKPGDAGFDFYTANSEDIILQPGETKLIPTGIRMAIPIGFYLAIVPRSGMSLKTKLRVANAPGTVDSGYRGHIQIMVENIGEDPITIEPHTRLAQGLILPVYQAQFELVDELPESERGEGGFGSTGMK